MGRANNDMAIAGITIHENHKTCPVVKRPGSIKRIPKTWSRQRATEQHSQNCTEKKTDFHTSPNFVHTDYSLVQNLKKCYVNRKLFQGLTRTPKSSNKMP